MKSFEDIVDEIIANMDKQREEARIKAFVTDISMMLRENGVIPCMSEVTAEIDDDDALKTVFCCRLEKLDFSAHDKVFEDKIAKLEKQIDRLNEEKSFLRTRCMPYVEKDFDNRLYGKLAIVSCNEEFVDIRKYADGDDLYSIEVRNLISEGGIKRLIGQYRNLSSRLDKMSAENKELKQRISELEIKETVDLPFDPLECANYLINATYERETNGIERTFHNLPDKVNSDRYTVDDLEQIAEHLLVYCKHNKESEG